MSLSSFSVICSQDREWTRRVQFFTAVRIVNKKEDGGITEIRTETNKLNG